MAEHLTVDQGVVGSTPISHPRKLNKDCLMAVLFISGGCPIEGCYGFDLLRDQAPQKIE